MNKYPIDEKDPVLVELKQREKDTLAAYHAARGAVKMYLLEKFPVKVGDIVVSQNDEYRVTRVVPDYGWLMGNRRRKNGSWSTGERRLYNDWTEKV